MDQEWVITRANTHAERLLRGGHHLVGTRLWDGALGAFQPPLRQPLAAAVLDQSSLRSQVRIQSYGLTLDVTAQPDGGVLTL